MSLPTIDEFLTWTYPTNSYVNHQGFKDLYVRSQRILVRMEDEWSICDPVLQIGFVRASRPGNGAFTALVEFLVERDLAIFVENVHNPRFVEKLLKMGFISVNPNMGAPNFLFNFENSLEKYEPSIV